MVFTAVVVLLMNHAYIDSMAIRVVEFSNGEYKIRKIFFIKIHIPKGNY